MKCPYCGSDDIHCDFTFGNCICNDCDRSFEKDETFLELVRRHGLEDRLINLNDLKKFAKKWGKSAGRLK